MVVIRTAVALLSLVSVIYAQNGATVEIQCRETMRYGFSVSLWPDGKRATSDEQERVRFSELASGEYRAEITAEGFSSIDTAFVLGAGEYRVLDIAPAPLAATLPDVIVQTDRSTASVQTFTRVDVERSSAPDLAEFLSREAGMDVRSDGVAGGTKTVRIGGSNPNQVLVLVDGARWQDNGSGTADISSIPVAWIERIDVYRGSRTQAGGEAIGGIIQIVTRRPTGRNELEGELTTRETSTHLSASREQEIGGFTAFVAYSGLHGPNNFRYRISEEDGNGAFTPDLGEIFRRQNAQVSRDQMLVKCYGGSHAGWSAGVTALLDRCTRGMPGYLAPLLTPAAGQTNSLSMINTEVSRASGRNNLRMRASYQDGQQEYTDPGPNSFVHHSEERSRTSEIETTGQWSNWHSVVGYGASAARESLDGDHLSTSTARRNRWSVWSTYRRILLESKSWSLSGQGGMRSEGFGNDHALLPRISLSLARAVSWKCGLDLAWGRSYRAPDFHALFWQDDQLAEGNPELKPERSYEWTGTAYVESPWSPSTRLEVNASVQKVEDLIFWHRSFDNRWKPLNLEAASVRTAGTSATQFVAGQRLRIQVGADWTDARDATGDRNTGGRYLTFRPLNSQRAAVAYRDHGLSGQVNWRRVSERPILESNSKWLSAYQLIDLQVGYTFRLRRTEFEPQIGVNNLLNENYRIIRFAPMPLREWYLTLRMRTL